MNELDDIRKSDLNVVNSIRQQVVASITDTVIAKRTGILKKDSAIKNISTLLTRFKNNIKTEITTKIHSFKQITLNFIGKNVMKIDQYQYVGPLDGKTRDFCKKHLGEIKTLAEWDTLGNGQIEPVSIYLGGFNCRHKLVGVKK